MHMLVVSCVPVPNAIGIQLDDHIVILCLISLPRRLDHQVAADAKRFIKPLPYLRPVLVCGGVELQFQRAHIQLHGVLPQGRKLLPQGNNPLRFILRKPALDEHILRHAQHHVFIKQLPGDFLPVGYGHIRTILHLGSRRAAAHEQIADQIAARRGGMHNRFYPLHGIPPSVKQAFHYEKPAYIIVLLFDRTA